MRQLATRPATKAFTLVELMVVMLILAGLAALAIKVGKHVAEQASRRETEARQMVLMQALNKYYEKFGKYPPCAETVAEAEAAVVRPEKMSSDVEFMIYAHSNQLVQALRNNTETEMFLRDLLNGVKQGDLNNAGTVVDSYGNDMDYLDTGGLGGSAVIISAGPDGYIGGEYADDDIRSDGR